MRLTALAALSLLGLTLASTPTQADDARPTTGDRKPNAKAMAAFIDAQTRALQDAEALTPAPVISDHDFLRRASLDLRGAPPSADEVLAFVKDKSEGKRAAKVLELLADEGYSEHWADVWKRALIGASTTQRRVFGELFEAYLRSALEKNMPYDALVREVLTAEGSMTENLAANYVLNYEAGPAELAAASARQFLGLQIECAQCHDHPYSDTKQSDFWGMAGYFGRVSQSRMRNMEDAKPGGATAMPGRPGLPGAQNFRITFSVRERSRGVLKLDENNEVVKPRDWGRSISPKFIVAGVDPDLEGGFRAAYAQAITSPKNPYFAKMAVNRVWYVLFGRGLVSPLEDLGQGVGLHPILLDGLAEAFVASGYDLKWLIEAIALSDTYQRDSRRPKSQEDPVAAARKAAKGKDADSREEAAARAALERALFARSELRPLSPEQLLRSIMRANELSDLRTLRRAQGYRARITAALRQFVQTFDNGVEGQVEEFSGTIPQALLMMNGDFVNKSIESDIGGVQKILKLHKDPKLRIQWIFLNILSRLPDDGEMKFYLGHVKKARNADAAYEDVAWVLMNSSEFLFNS